MWTLQYFGPGGTVEKPLATLNQNGTTVPGWGISGNSSFEFHSTSKSAVHIVTTDSFDAAFQFAYNRKVVIRRDRVHAGSAFNGGSIWFTGFVSQPARIASGAKQNHQYTFYNWADWAERIGFRQPWKFINGGTVLAPTYTTYYLDEVCLGEDVNEMPLDVAAQITEVLTSMNQRFNSTRWRSHAGAVDASQDLVQVGAIAGAGVAFPKNPMSCVACYEALRTCLKQIPDAVMWTDYTTSPPTVNVTNLAAMATATMTLPGTDVTKVFNGLTLKPRYDRQLNGILIAYKQPFTLDGQTTVGVFYDKYPPTCDQDDPLVLSYVITLGGAKVDVARCTVQTIAVNATSIAWWQQHDDRLNNARIVPGSLHVDPTTLTVTDRNGNPVSLAAYPFQLMPDYGAPMPGLGVNSQQIIIKIKGSWSLLHPTIAALTTDTETAGELVARITVCDLDTGGVAVEYSKATVEATGEGTPPGLAQYLYNAFSALQYEGSLETVGQDIRGDIALGQKLTIITPGGNYPNSLIQSVSGEIAHGVLKAQIGPPGVLGLSDIIEQMRALRYLQLWKLPTGRSTGTPPGASTTSLASVSARENTIPSFGAPSLKAYHAPDAADGTRTNMLVHDPANGSFTFKQYKTADGTLYTTGILAPSYNGNGAPSGSTLA